MVEYHNPIRIFVSHSAMDRDFVEPLVDLLRTSLRLAAHEIRCTSLEGYRLPGAANTDSQIRAEVQTSEAFIGIISTHSLHSMYVLFELGARWGSEKHLLPLLTPGAESSLLEAPLAGLNALRTDSSAQLHQLVQDLGNVLNIQPESPAVYQRYIDTLLSFAKGLADNQGLASNNDSIIEIIKGYSTNLSEGFYVHPSINDNDLNRIISISVNIFNVQIERGDIIALIRMGERWTHYKMVALTEKYIISNFDSPGIYKLNNLNSIEMKNHIINICFKSSQSIYFDVSYNMRGANILCRILEKLIKTFNTSNTISN